MGMKSVKYGALEIAVTDQFVRLWDDRGSGATLHGAFFDPLLTEEMHGTGWRVLGSLGHVGDHQDITGKRATILARNADPGAEMVKPPVDFRLIWKDQGSGAELNGSVWRPVPPEGYVCLGDVWHREWDKPEARWYGCIRQEHAGRAYVRQGQIGDLIWWDKRSGASANVATYSIQPGPYPADTTQRLILGAGLLLAVDHYDQPTDAVYVLDLPAAVVTSDPAPSPELVSHEQIPAETDQVVDRVVTVPCTVIQDPGKTLAWQVANSPFYTLERRTSWKKHIWSHNPTGNTESTGEYAVTTGVTKTTGEEFTKRTAITVGASAGIALKGFSASVETSVTTELGYTKRYEVSTFTEETHRHNLIIPPNSTGALWSARHEIVPRRADGDVVGGQGGLPLNTVDFLTGHYPNGAAVRHTIDGDEV
ncbi:Vps62-related protein [Streptomyces pimonensis]|uniref:Vps62-related protein n=1 Tax=Streptomyces pimonensis TaxID=2860288 RepID=A0ABV4J8J3_9ACTN